MISNDTTDIRGQDSKIGFILWVRGMAQDSPISQSNIS